MAVTIIKPYATSPKRNYLEHHRNPSGTINKAKWLLSRSERDINKFNSLICSIEAGVLSSFEEKSWLAAISMRETEWSNRIEELKTDLEYAKAIIKDLLNNSHEYAIQNAEDFIKGEKK